MAAVLQTRSCVDAEAVGLSPEALSVHQTMHGWALASCLTVEASKNSMTKKYHLIPNYQPDLSYENADHLRRESLVYEWFVKNEIHPYIVEASDTFGFVCSKVKDPAARVALLDPADPGWKSLPEIRSAHKNTKQLLKEIEHAHKNYVNYIETIRANATYRLIAAVHAALGPHDPGLLEEANKLVLTLCTTWATHAELLLFKHGFIATEEYENMPWRNPGDMSLFEEEWRALFQMDKELKDSGRSIFVRRVVAYADRIDVLCNVLERRVRLSWPGGYANESYHVGKLADEFKNDPALSIVVEKTLRSKGGLIYAWADINCQVDGMQTPTYERGRPMFPLVSFRVRINAILMCLDGSRRGWRNNWKDATSPRPFYALKVASKAASQRFAFNGHSLNLPVANMCLSTLDATGASFQKLGLDVDVVDIPYMDWTSPTDELFCPPFYVCYNSDRHGRIKLSSLLAEGSSILTELYACRREPSKTDFDQMVNFTSEFFQPQGWNLAALNSREKAITDALRESLATAMIVPLQAALGPHHPSSKFARPSCKGNLRSMAPLLHDSTVHADFCSRVVQNVMVITGVTEKHDGATGAATYLIDLESAILAIRGLFQIFAEHVRSEWPFDRLGGAKEFIVKYVKGLFKTASSTATKYRETKYREKMKEVIEASLRSALDMFLVTFDRPSKWLWFLLDLSPLTDGACDWTPELCQTFVDEVKRQGWRCTPYFYTKILWARASYIANHVIRPDFDIGFDRMLLAEAQLTSEQRMITQNENGYAVNFHRFGTLWSDYPSYVRFSLSNWVAFIISGQSKQKSFTPQSPLPSWCADIANLVEEVTAGIESNWELKMTATRAQDVTAQDQFAWQQTRRHKCCVNSKGGLLNTAFDGFPEMGLEIMRALSNSERVWRLTQRTITCPKSVPDESPSVFSPLGRAMRWMFANDEYKDLVAYVMVAEPGSAEESFACPVMLDDIPRLFRTCSFKEPIASLLQLHEQWERIWSAHVWNGANHRWDIGHNSVLATVLPTLWLLAREYARRESSPSEVVEQEPYVHQDYEYPTFCGHGVWPKKFGFTRDAMHIDEPDLGDFTPESYRMRRCRVLHVWYFIHMLKRGFGTGAFPADVVNAEISAQRIGISHSVSCVGVLRERVLEQIIATVAPTNDEHTSSDLYGRIGKRAVLRLGFRCWAKMRARRRAANGFFERLAKALPKLKEVAYTKS